MTDSIAKFFSLALTGEFGAAARAAARMAQAVSPVPDESGTIEVTSADGSPIAEHCSVGKVPPAPRLADELESSRTSDDCEREDVAPPDPVNTEVTDEDVIDLALSAGLNIQAYSGRGMHGQSCLGIPVDSAGDALSAAAMIMAEATYYWPADAAFSYRLRNLAERLESASSDSMGRGLIIYWPSIEMDED